MVNTIHKNTFLFSKVMIFIIIALLNISFIDSPPKDDFKISKKIHKNIQNIFKTSLYKTDSMSDNFYKILESDTIIGYFITEQMFSKYKKFDYLIIYNEFAEILKVEILTYRENYGFEICNKRWLQQFIRNNSNSEFDFNLKIDAISGATISVNNLIHATFMKTQNLKRIIDE